MACGIQMLGDPEGKRPLGRYRRRLHDNIKMGLKTCWMGVRGLD